MLLRIVLKFLLWDFDLSFGEELYNFKNVEVFYLVFKVFNKIKK